MNMILHGIRSADIRQGDTLKDPQHLAQNGEIRRFDRVIANPPFSQNYSQADMKFHERFHTFMPENGKKADLMFVQHMVASLKSGRQAGGGHAPRRAVPWRRGEGVPQAVHQGSAFWRR